MKRNLLTLSALLAVMLALAAPTTFAQGPSFSEGFDDVGATDPAQDGPVNLIARGWIFRNQSEPEGTSDWYGSDGGQVMDPHAGTGFLAADFNNTDPYEPGAAISSWAMRSPGWIRMLSGPLLMSTALISPR